MYGAPHTGNNAAKYVYDSTNKWDVADFNKNTKGEPIPSDKASLRGYLVDNYTVHTYPTLVTATVWFEPHVEYVYLNRFYFNHSNGKDSDGNVITCNQWIAGLSLELDIPKQEDVDAAQNDAIAGLQEFQKQSLILATIPVSYTHLTLPTKRIV